MENKLMAITVERVKDMSSFLNNIPEIKAYSDHVSIHQLTPYLKLF